MVYWKTIWQGAGKKDHTSKKSKCLLRQYSFCRTHRCRPYSGFSVFFSNFGFLPSLSDILVCHIAEEVRGRWNVVTARWYRRDGEGKIVTERGRRRDGDMVRLWRQDCDSEIVMTRWLRRYGDREMLRRWMDMVDMDMDAIFKFVAPSIYHFSKGKVQFVKTGTISDLLIASYDHCSPGQTVNTRPVNANSSEKYTREDILQQNV